MKPGIHPKYAPVAFRDITSGTVTIINSTVETDKTIEHEGATYPVVNLDISSDSHPFYTGKQRIVDTAGRVDRFNQRRAAGEQAAKDAAKAAKAAAKK
jgi:large subunit ribosomal protein L31